MFIFNGTIYISIISSILFKDDSKRDLRKVYRVKHVCDRDFRNVKSLKPPLTYNVMIIENTMFYRSI